MARLIVLAIFALTVFSAVLAAPIAKGRDIVYEVFPNYLVPAVQAFPGTAYSTQNTGHISYSGNDLDLNETTMFVGFDIPANEATNCVIKFALPPPSVPWGYEWKAQGSGRFDVYLVTSLIVPRELSWENRPQRYQLPVFSVTQPTDGGEATVDGPNTRCFNGQRMDFELVATRESGSMRLDWFELDNPRTGITMEMSP
ncbi:hypothetical protein DFP73DRAFT_598052 [Morchella snyderi]|nr:hypothetical protein DFP73DRAFT_598052 [Morchella snyderi]